MADRPADPAVRTIAAAQRGDTDALAQLMALHDGSMRRICMVILGDAVLVDDAVQAAWVRAWRSIGSVRDAARLRAWLMSVAANEARQLVRSASRRRQYEGKSAEARVPADPAGAIERLDVARAVARLGPDDRRLIALRYLGGLSSEEIAAEIGGSASTVRGRLARILAQLRAEVGP